MEALLFLISFAGAVEGLPILKVLWGVCLRAVGGLTVGVGLILLVGKCSEGDQSSGMFDSSRF